MSLPLTDDQRTARRQLDEARQAFRDRKRDARRKIVAGAVVLRLADHDPAAFKALLQLILQQHVTRPIDRQLFADRSAEQVSGIERGNRPFAHYRAWLASKPIRGRRAGVA